FSSRRRHTRLQGDWSSDVCSSDLFPSQPSQILRQTQLDLDLAALRETIHVPAQGRRQTNFVQQGWMQQVRNRPNFAQGLGNELIALGEKPCCFWLNVT